MDSLHLFISSFFQKFPTMSIFYQPQLRKNLEDGRFQNLSHLYNQAMASAQLHGTVKKAVMSNAALMS